MALANARARVSSAGSTRTWTIVTIVCSVLIGLIVLLAANNVFNAIASTNPDTTGSNNNMSVAITTPQPNDPVKGKFDIAATVTNPTDKVDHVEIVRQQNNDATTQISIGNVKRANATGAAGQPLVFTVSWDSTSPKINDGEYQLFAKVYDNGTNPLATSTIISVKLGNGTTTSGSNGSGNGTVTSDQVNAAKLNDPGPGNCVAGTEILKEHPNTSRTELKKDWTDWIASHTDTPCVVSMAKSVNVAPKDLAKWINDNLYLQTVGTRDMVVQNTYYGTDGQLHNWQVQKLQSKELVFVGKRTGNPYFLFACGNRLTPVKVVPKTPPAKVTPPTPSHPTTPTAPSHPTTPTTPTPTCKDHCGTTPPKCTKDCGTTPPSCTKDCNTTPPPTCENGGKKDCGTTPPTCENGGKTDCTPPPTCENGGKTDCNTDVKPPQTWECQQNGGPNCPPNGGHQDPQDNTTSGVNTGPTGSNHDAPTTTPTHPVDNRGDGNGNGTSQAPTPTQNGSDSGHSDGSGTPSGSLNNGNGTTVDNSGHGNGVTDTNTEASGSTGSTHVTLPTDN